jgi:hypothetical protein
MENATSIETPILSKWRFWLFWLGANALGFSLAYIIISSLFFQQLIDKLFPGATQLSVSRLYLALAVLSAIIVALAQWVVLRTWLKQAHWWLAATAIGWIFIILVSSNEMNSFVTAVTNNDSLLASYMNLLSFAAYGLILGLVQWLVLRFERPRSALIWIGWSTLGTVVSTAIIFLPLNVLSTLPSPSAGVTQLLQMLSQMDLLQLWVFRLIQWGIVAAVSGFGLYQVLSRPGERRQAEVQANQWPRFLLYWSLGTLLALFINFEFAPSFLSFWSALQSDATLHNLAIDLFMGLIIGVMQWLVLREHYKNAYLWILATMAGYALLSPNQSLLPVLYPNTTFLNLANFGDVIRYISYVLSGSLGYLIVLGALQALLLSMWLGKRAWAWVLAVPAIQIVALLVSLLLWGPIGSLVQAIGSGLWLVYLIRSGLLEEAYFAPQTESAPSEYELEMAAQILQERMAASWAIQGQAAVDAGRLRVEVASHDDANDVSDLALQQGKAVFFKVDASATLEEGATLPKDAQIILTEDDLEAAEAFEASGEEQAGVEIKLTDEGKQKLDQAWKKTQPLRLGLALDEEVVAALDVEMLDAEGIYAIHPYYLDPNFLAAILDNDPLPFPLKTSEEEEEE